jgi:acyl-CoA thioesterase FadM
MTLTTRITGYRRVWARRHTAFELPDGSLAAWAHTDWVILDRRGLPTRVPQEFPSRLAEPPGSFTPTRVDLPPAPSDALARRFGVRPQDLDPLAHVNNAAYLDYVDEAVGRLPEGARQLAAIPRTYRLEYATAAEPDAILDCLAWPIIDSEQPAIAVRLATMDGSEVFRAIVMT